MAASETVSKLLARRCICPHSNLSMLTRQSVKNGPLSASSRHLTNYGISSNHTLLSSPLPSSSPLIHQSRQFFEAAGPSSSKSRPVHVDPGKRYTERVVLGYSPQQLFDVVANVDEYKYFLPWCTDSRVLRKTGPSSFQAELRIGFKLLSEAYTSEVILERSHIKVHVQRGKLFNHLRTEWEFLPGPDANSCTLGFTVGFQFASSLHQGVANLFLREVVSTLRSSFEKRCAQRYGPSSRPAKSLYSATLDEIRVPT